MILPNEMMSLLHAPYPESIRANLRWAGLSMLKELYAQNPSDPNVRAARLALQTALAEWDDAQVLDFLTNHVLQPPQSTDFLTKSPTEYRKALQAIYNYLFTDDLT